MNFIHTIPKAYSKKSCTQLINWFENNIDKAKPGTVGKEKLNNLEITLVLKDKTDYFNLGKTIIKSINNFKKNYPYVDKHIGKWQLNPFMQLMKYEPNNYYNVIHCENSGDNQTLKRVFAFMIFLNDIKKGGGTKFLFQKFIAKPKEGDFYIWPAYWTHLHQGVNAPKENKYIITGWVEYI
jgi:prolyl 4-hydroxylase